MRKFLLIATILGCAPPEYEPEYGEPPTLRMYGAAAPCMGDNDGDNGDAYLVDCSGDMEPKQLNLSAYLTIVDEDTPLEDLEACVTNLSYTDAEHVDCSVVDTATNTFGTEFTVPFCVPANEFGRLHLWWERLDSDTVQPSCRHTISVRAPGADEPMVSRWFYVGLSSGDCGPLPGFPEACNLFN